MQKCRSNHDHDLLFEKEEKNGNFRQIGVKESDLKPE